MNRKLSAFFAAALMALAFAGCGQNEASQSQQETSVSTDGIMASETESVTQEEYKMEISITEYVDNMSPGWNLGNSLDATGGETSWGNPKITRELITAVKESGYNSIRVPVTWDMYISDDYTVSAEYIARVKEVVDWCLEEDLYVMINLHHDSWNWINTYDKDKTVKDKFVNVWTQIAYEFRNYDMRLMFESINEPYFDSGDEQAMLDELNIAFVETVRSSGGSNSERPLVLPALYTSAETKHCSALMNTIEAINDPYIIATVHYYAPWTFSVNIAGSHKFDDSVAAEIKTAFDICYDELVSKGVPVVVGEYGVLGSVHSGEYYKYIEYLYSVTNGRGITLMKWDNGGGLNRLTYKWRDEYDQEMTIACAASRSSYTEQNMIFVTDEAADITQQLSLNGNTLVEIKCADAVLNSESDYTVAEDKITFSGDYLKRFAEGEYGEKAELTMVFSDGADWHISIYYSTLPEYGTLDAGRKGLSIPVRFNGNVVATLEAIDPATGEGIGPHNWTTYKEFNYAFTVNYESGYITLTNEFKKEISNGDILFRIHYVNGSADEYLVTVSDDGVVGAPVTREATFGETAASGIDEDDSADGGNVLLASHDVADIDATAFSVKAYFTIEGGEEPGICVRLNDTDDQFFYLGATEYNGWFQSYPHLGGLLVQESGEFESDIIEYGNITDIAFESWGSRRPDSIEVFLYKEGQLAATVSYSSECSEVMLAHS